MHFIICFIKKLAVHFRTHQWGLPHLTYDGVEHWKTHLILTVSTMPQVINEKRKGYLWNCIVASTSLNKILKGNWAIILLANSSVGAAHAPRAHADPPVLV